MDWLEILKYIAAIASGLANKVTAKKEEGK